MNHENRSTIIKKIEKERSSKIITYVTGDRTPFNTKVADDAVPIFAKHLAEIGPQEKISLFLYTRGGDMIAPIRIVKLIRSYTKKVEILIPYRAHSAGTLLSIGTDLIVMGRLGELSPVDPSTGHPFNPENPHDTKQKMQISVEDLNSYFLLAKEKAGVQDEGMTEIFKQLTDKIHPLAIGNIYRAARMAQQIAYKLLKTHLKNDEDKISKIVKELTGDICIHGYPITRDEAEELGLNVEYANEDTDKLMWSLYESYAKEMKFKNKFNPLKELEHEEIKKIKCIGAFVESANKSDNFPFGVTLKKTFKNNQPSAQVKIEQLGWKSN